MTPIGWAEFDAFLRHARIALVPWEVAAIEDIDDAYLSAKAKKGDEEAD